MTTEPTTKLAIVTQIHQIIEASVEKKPFMMLFAVNLSVTILEALEYGEISEIWSKLIQIYVHLSESGNPRIRNGGVYGLNLVSRKSPPGVLGQSEISHIMQILSNAFSSPFEDEDDMYYVNHCKDNVISALGNLLKCYSTQFPDILNKSIFGYWLSNLPLNTDKSEGDKQQEILIEILSQNPILLIRDAKDLKVVL